MENIARTAMLEVIVSLDGEPFAYHTLEPGQALTCGPRAGCNVVVPEHLIGAPTELARHLDVEHGGVFDVCLPAGARMVTVDDAGHTETMLGDGRTARLGAAVAAEVSLGERLTIQLRQTDTPERVGVLGRVSWREQRGTIVSAGLHLLLIFFVAAIPPDGFALTTDHFDKDARFIKMLHQPLDKQIPHWLNRGQAGAGKAAAGEKGEMGDPKAKKNRKKKRYGVKGTAAHSQPRGPLDVKGTGVLGSIAASRTFALLADPTRRAIGGDAQQALGSLIGDQIGPEYGVGGLALDGTGRGGGCVGVDCGAVGVGDADFGRIGWTKAPGSNYGWGRGKGPKSPGHRPRAPVVLDGVAKLRGALSKAIIRRVVRRHINQVRYCYERALQNDRKLRGRVVVSFLITGTGQVGSSAVAESTLGSRQVEQCVAQAVRRWAFPKPEGGGLVTVSYPFTFHAAGR